MQNARLDEAQAGIRRNINNLRYADDTTPISKSEELKGLSIKVKKESEKVGLKFNIQKNRNMASGPITSWQTDGKTMETMRGFIFLGSKITADGDCSHEIKRRLLLRPPPQKKSYDEHSDHIKKNRDISLQTSVCIVNTMFFPVVM